MTAASVPDHLGGFVPGGDDATYYPLLWQWLVQDCGITSVLDIGCGDGVAVRYFRELGCFARGVDGVPQDDPDIRKWDFTEGAPTSFDLDLMRPVELVWCCELVEHVEERYLSNVLDAFQHGRLVLLTHADPGQQGHHHVNCVIEGTRTASTRPERAFRRRYRGPAVTIVTASGNELTVTPNHPVLTTRGWKAAELLQEDDDVVCCDLGERIGGGVVPDAYERPAAIEQVFRSIEEGAPAAITRVPIAAHDFHGDGADSHVDVVETDRLLRDAGDAAIFEPSDQNRLERRLMRRAIHAGLRARDLRLLGVSSAAAAAHKPLDRSLAVGRRHLFPAPRVAFADGGKRFASADQNTLDDHLGRTRFASDLLERGFVAIAPEPDDQILIDVLPDALVPGPDSDASHDQGGAGSPEVDVRLGRELGERLSGRVAVEKIVSLHTSEYVGHVYNLQTAEGAYWANGLIVHNCRTREYWRGAMAAIGYVEDTPMTEATRALARVNPSPWNHYARSGLAFRPGA